MRSIDPSDVRPLDHRDVQVWQTVYWAELARRLTPAFARTEARTRALAYVAGLLSPAERKNGWQLAEITGARNPYGVQHLLGRAVWEPDSLRDQLRTYVTDYLADDQAIGVIDETGFLKKGRHSAGVARQYSGTAGRIENCQIGVFLTYASQHGHTLLDRELYLPKEWTDDPARCRAAGVPAERVFATKPVLARQMLERALVGGVQLAWVTGDSVYGDDRALRQWLEARLQAYVLAVSGKETVWIAGRQQTVKAWLAALPSQGWERISAGAGSKGLRWYDWQRWELADPPQPGWQRWLLVRRSISDPTDVAAYISYAPAASRLADLVAVAGQRWTVEESIQTAKGEVGLDHYEVRAWRGWYRHMTLAMWAQAFLSVLRKETGEAEALLKGGAGTSQPSSLATFKARRGLQSA
jgi:SRSO17 transposase